MKKLIYLLMSAIVLMSCAKNDNPFFSAYENEYGAPPFDKIKTEHYMPAFKEGIKQHQAEIDAIANSSDEPTFANTIEALDYSGDLLNKVNAVFFNLYSSTSNEEMEKIATEVSPLLSEHNDNMYLNENFSKRLKPFTIIKRNWV